MTLVIPDLSCTVDEPAKHDEEDDDDEDDFVHWLEPDAGQEYPEGQQVPPLQQTE
jgi:hypothetical protein